MTDSGTRRRLVEVARELFTSASVSLWTRRGSDPVGSGVERLGVVKPTLFFPKDGRIVRKDILF